MNQANQNNPLVKVAFKSIAGTLVYELADITHISAMRGVAAEKAKRFASLNITSEELTALLDKAIDGINSHQPNLSQAISILHELQFRNKMICEENSLLDLACIFLLIEGEDIDNPSEQVNKQKLELLHKEPDLKAFFLTEAFRLAGLLSTKQGASLLDYLEETKHLVTAMNRHLQT